MPRLQVKIGSNRFETGIAHVNHSDKPYEIDNEYFTGRVLVLVKDFAGVTPDGSAPKPHNQFFDGRSRKFAILIEGRFKGRKGVEPYNGDEVEFGSDFDYLPESFPRAPLDAGLKVAKWIDPAMHYLCEPGSKPFIMSPYNAAVNTLCAYPAPSGLSRAVVLALHDNSNPHHDGEEQEVSLVPTGQLDDSKRKWSSAPPVWRFLGLRGEPKVEEFIAAHQELQPPSATPSATPSPNNTLPPSSAHSSAGRPGFQHRPSSLALGTANQSASSRGSIDLPPTLESERSSHNNSPVLSSDRQRTGSPPRIDNSRTSSPAPSKPKKKSKFSLSGLMGALDISGGNGKSESEGHEHLLTPEQVLQAEQAGVAKRQANDASYQPNPVVEKELGPWRFADESVDAAEATDFVFLDPDHPRTVAQRRKHFCAQNGKYRKEFIYDPDTIYTTSFFAPFCDLNTLDLKLGPVKMNISSFIGSGDLMPIRYTLRSTRMASSPDPSAKEGEMEAEGFATIEFKLVD